MNIMALNACWGLTRCVLRAVGSRSGAGGALTVRSRTLCGRGGVMTALWRRGLCSADRPVGPVAYEQVKKLLVARTGVLIDVREPWELREYGAIPGAINVPLGHVREALQLKPEEFKERYGGEMPSTGECLVFTCLAGVRSEKAVKAAQSLGYANVHHYSGGWKDWAKHEILQAKA